MEIGNQVFEKDSYNYEEKPFYLIIEEISTFYTHQRRKYLPCWIIKEISSKFICQF